MAIAPFFHSALENIYISPLELCNLNCQICYTNKTKHILTNEQILNFVSAYSSYLNTNQLNLKSILFCGGEVFTLPTFIPLINTLLYKNIFISIITNGTIDHLDQITDPKNCQLLVSFDGPKAIHDANRGRGNFQKSVNFVKHARTLGFPVEIMYLVTPQSYEFIDTFSIENVKNNFITVKTKFYTDKHPLAVDTQSPGLTKEQILNIKRNYKTIPAKDFGCFQLSLQSNGKIYGCCETPRPIGLMTDNPQVYVDAFTQSLNPCLSCVLRKGEQFLSAQSSEQSEGASTAKIGSPADKICGGCCDQDFLCGYKRELAVEHCTDVVTLFNS